MNAAVLVADWSTYVNQCTYECMEIRNLTIRRYQGLHFQSHEQSKGKLWFLKDKLYDELEINSAAYQPPPKKRQGNPVPLF